MLYINCHIARTEYMFSNSVEIFCNVFHHSTFMMTHTFIYVCVCAVSHWGLHFKRFCCSWSIKTVVLFCERRDASSSLPTKLWDNVLSPFHTVSSFTEVLDLNSLAPNPLPHQQSTYSIYFNIHMTQCESIALMRRCAAAHPSVWAARTAICGLGHKNYHFD